MSTNKNAVQIVAAGLFVVAVLLLYYSPLLFDDAPSASAAAPPTSLSAGGQSKAPDFASHVSAENLTTLDSEAVTAAVLAAETLLLNPIYYPVDLPIVMGNASGSN